MFRTVIVHQGERIGIRDNHMTVDTGDGVRAIPLEGIYAVVIDNQSSSLTVPAITRLTSGGAHLLVCNEKHVPVSVILPQNTHYHPLSVIRKQIDMPQEFRDALWDRIIRAKIRNQAAVLRLCGCKMEKSDRLLALANEVQHGDEGNREGIAAKMFFHTLYGSEFVRMADDGINSALNYGYAIIRSAVCKTLCAYGYNCVLGLHHISESDPFNLAEDIMEPYRPIVDMWVDDHHEELLDVLTRGQRNALVALVNDSVRIKNKTMRIRNAIDETVCSLTTSIHKGDPDCLILPEIVRTSIYADEAEEE